jgi:hypothetical protein
MFPADIQDLAYLPNNNSHKVRKWFFTIITPSDEDIGKLLEAREENILRWLVCYKVIDDMKVRYLQGGLIFKDYAHDRTWLKHHLCSHTTWFIMMGSEKQIVEYCSKDLHQGKDNTTLIYGGNYTKKFIFPNTPEEYGSLTQLLSEDKIYLYEICENYPQIYETYYKALEKVAFERDRNKERKIPEVNWIYGLPGSEKTKLAQVCLKRYDLMKKHDFVYTGLYGRKNIIYENVKNNESLE